jgi:hypothetical protein
MVKTGFINKDNVIDLLMTDELIVQSYVYSDSSSKFWKINNPLTVRLSNDKIINIPKGFYYDMSTVPKWLWSIVRPYNDGLFGYLIHDRLYVIKNHNMTRKECDKEMLFWTNITNKNKFDNYLRYYFVRLFGWLIWYEII